MFSGIVEGLAKVNKIEKEGSNLHFTLDCDFTSELQIDQSIAHNGVCLTVTSISGNSYKVTAIEETLNKSSLGNLSEGDEVNLERCLRLSDRLDGHIVQGHVDGTAEVRSIEDRNGSWEIGFELDKNFDPIEGKSPEKLIIQKGSISINGTSLTVAWVNERQFGVAIIPYTFEHTNFRRLKVGNQVNIELDILGKYVAKIIPQG